jgi:hypothetical protein
MSETTGEQKKPASTEEKQQPTDADEMMNQLMQG